MFWVFTGAAHRAVAWIDEYDIGLPVLVDDNGSFQEGWFVGQGQGEAWAGNPRHYVIDGAWTLRYGASTPLPEALMDSIQAQLDAR